MNKIEIKDNICIITLENKPQNYLDEPEFVNTNELKKLIESNLAKAIIIHGAGRHFSGGANREALKQQIENKTLKSKITKGKQLLNYIQSLQIPILAAIEGVCFGGGLEIALSTDIRIAGTKALFAFPETNMNIIPGLNGIINTSKAAGQNIAMEMVLSGDMIDAENAKHLGLIDETCEPKTAFETAYQKAKKMTSNKSLEIIKAVTELTRNTKTLPMNQAIQQETEVFCELARKARENNEF